MKEINFDSLEDVELLDPSNLTQSSHESMIENDTEFVQSTEQKPVIEDPLTETKVDEETITKPPVIESNKYQDVAEAWNETGMLGDVSEEDLKIKDEEGFINLINKQADARAKQILVEKYGEQAESRIEAGSAGMDPTTILNMDNYINSLETLKETISDDTEDMVKTRKDIINAALKEQGFTESAIERSVKRIINSGDDIEEARESIELLANLANKEKADYILEIKESKEKREKDNKQFIVDIKDTINKKKEIIPGVKITDLVKEKILKGIINPINKSKFTGTPISKVDSYMENNPKEARIVLSYLLEITKNFEDWSVFQKAAKKQAVSKLDRTITDIHKNIQGSSGMPNREFNSMEFDESSIEKLELTQL